MKFILVLLSLFSFEALAQANYCDYLVVKESEQCRPLITFLPAKKLFKKCSGELEGGLSCRVLISLEDSHSVMSMNCKNAVGATEIEEDIEADVSLYQSSAVITAVDGSEKLFTDSEVILFADHPMLQVSAKGGRANVLYTKWNGEQELMTNVMCE